ncbi:uncharacterized protein [Amphiura filiformis]|uniref:uncharacterized protein n=1 Tax=Amphiura filiformis TaxID=82378 RepID=UPI003B223006
MALTPYGGSLPGTLRGPPGSFGGASLPGTLRGPPLTGSFEQAAFAGSFAGASVQGTLRGAPSIYGGGFGQPHIGGGFPPTGGGFPPISGGFPPSGGAFPPSGGGFGQPPTGGPLPLAGDFSFGATPFGGPYSGSYTNPHGGVFGDRYGGYPSFSHHGYGSDHGGYGKDHGGYGKDHGGYGRDHRDREYGSEHGGCGSDYGGYGSDHREYRKSRRGDAHCDPREPDFLRDPAYCRVTRITPFLFLTNKTGLTVEIVQRLDITLVICASESHEIEPPSTRYHGYCDFKRVPVPNDPTSSGPNIIQYFDEIAELIHAEQRRGGRVLVHSLKGRSRGPTLVIAYLIKYQHMKLCEAFGMVSGQRQIIKPFYAFWKQLIQYEKELYGRSTAVI